MPALIQCRGCSVEFLAKRSDAMWCADCRAANAKGYSRNYDRLHPNHCMDCGKVVVRSAKRCNACDIKWRRVRYRAEGNPNWHEGRITDKQGYVHVRITPKVHKVGAPAYKREHRVIWEAAHGPLASNYIIHHLNGNKADNRLENLAAMSRSDHHVRHAEPYEKRIRELEAEVNELRGKNQPNSQVEYGPSPLAYGPRAG